MMSNDVMYFLNLSQQTELSTKSIDYVHVVC